MERHNLSFLLKDQKYFLPCYSHDRSHPKNVGIPTSSFPNLSQHHWLPSALTDTSSVHFSGLIPVYSKSSRWKAASIKVNRSFALNHIWSRIWPRIKRTLFTGVLAGFWCCSSSSRRHTCSWICMAISVVWPLRRVLYYFYMLPLKTRSYFSLFCSLFFFLQRNLDRTD